MPQETHIELFECSRCGRRSPCHGRRTFIEETWEQDCAHCADSGAVLERTVYHYSHELCGRCSAELETWIKAGPPKLEAVRRA